MPFCNSCGRECPEFAAVCEGCGTRFVENRAVPQQPPKQLSGVQGWLLLFCVGLTILGPLNYFYLGISTARTMALGPLTPKERFFDVLILIQAAVLTAFSFIAGFFMWTVRPRAVLFAKAFLFAVLLIPLFLFALRLGLGLEQYDPGRVAARILRSSIFTIVWYSYLVSSIRVQNTYRHTHHHGLSKLET